MRVFWWVRSQLRSQARRFASLKHVLALPFCLLFMIMVIAPYKGNGVGEPGVGTTLLAYDNKNWQNREQKKEDYKFKNFNVDQWNTSQRVMLVEDTSEHFREVSGHQCYVRGTDFEKSSKNCVCVSGFFGPHCGVPRSAWESHFKQNADSLAKLTPRKLPRRLIHGLQVTKFYVCMVNLPGKIVCVQFFLL